jgi:hypothetical protein
MSSRWLSPSSMPRSSCHWSKKLRLLGNGGFGEVEVE